jgi:hypothetical protein
VVQLRQHAAALKAQQALTGLESCLIEHLGAFAWQMTWGLALGAVSVRLAFARTPHGAPLE